jgi:hypothetical protein
MTPISKIKYNLALPIEARKSMVMVNQIPSVAVDVPSLLVDFNALLLKLRTAGYLDG